MVTKNISSNGMKKSEVAFTARLLVHFMLQPNRTVEDILDTGLHKYEHHVFNGRLQSVFLQPKPVLLTLTLSPLGRALSHCWD